MQNIAKIFFFAKGLRNFMQKTAFKRLIVLAIGFKRKAIIFSDDEKISKISNIFLLLHL